MADNPIADPLSLRCEPSRELNKLDRVISRNLLGGTVRCGFYASVFALTWLTIFFASSVNAQNSVSADKPESTTGHTLTPETKGQKQPQGWTGPINTGQGGAPASSPQGQSPPGMQSAPEGSSKTATEPDKNK